MAVNADFVGRVFTGTSPYEVSRVKIAEFASAVQAQHPSHYDAAAARELGYGDVIAPATFAVVIAQRAEHEYLDEPEASLDFSRVVHADQRFTHHRPICAGDVLSAAVHVDGIVERRGLTLVSLRAEITDADGAAVCTARSTYAVRGE
jgi:acyl dehydratase